VRRARRVSGSLAALALIGAAAGAQAAPAAASPALLLQSDYGLQDGAVAALKGVAFTVSPTLRVVDITHLITPFNVLEAAYRLRQVAPFWPAGTVFVSIVDPGVGTTRRSVVMKSKTGQYFVTPDNGTLTYVGEFLGVAEVREIDESVNRLPGSEWSATFHGRDVYVYTAARLAAGVISFEQVGPSRGAEYVALEVAAAQVSSKAVRGTIVVLDQPYGNLWTNIDTARVAQIGIRTGDRVRVRIFHGAAAVWTAEVPLATTFGDVPVGKPVLYVNSLNRIALALNQDSFAKRYSISAGADWTLELVQVSAAH
jgi:S-adenosylmethionine hydrolase